jgi:hypothetical protein
MSAAPSAAPAGGGLANGWVEVASFGADDTIETVNDLVEAPFGLLAAGVHIRTRNPGVFGELPREGRVWLSADGQAWEDVTPTGTFDDASIQQLVALPDGAVLTLAMVNVVDPETGSPVQRNAAWETFDGRTWTSADLSLDPGTLASVADGGRGYLAAIIAEFRTQLGYSSDGRTFVEVAEAASSRIARSMGGGPEGFVVITQAYESAESPVAYASGDGTTWFEATTPDWNAVGVAPLGADWVAIDSGPFDSLQDDSESQSWFSPNGLDWRAAGRVPVRALPLPDDATCRELVTGLTSTGSMVVTRSHLSHPCGEGNVQTFGASHVSADGATWLALPFTVRETAYDESTRGATITAGIDLPSGSLLVGENAYRATIWFRPAD